MTDLQELRAKTNDALENLVAAEKYGMLNYIDWMIVGVRDMESLLDRLEQAEARCCELLAEVNVARVVAGHLQAALNEPGEKPSVTAPIAP